MKCGVLDFAGSGVVHFVGGTAALVAAVFIGPRMYRFVDGNYRVNGGKRTQEVVDKGDLDYKSQLTGTFLLWFGWIGFNTVSTGSLDGNNLKVAGVVLINTILGGSIGGISSLAAGFVFDERFNYYFGIDGTSLLKSSSITLTYDKNRRGNHHLNNHLTLNHH